MNNTKIQEIINKIEESAYEYQLLSEEEKSIYEVTLAAVKKEAYILKYVPHNFRNDKAIVIEAVRKDWKMMEYVSDELKNDKIVVATAIKNSGEALKFASEQMKSNKELAIEAMKNNWKAINYFNESLFRDKDIALAILGVEGTYYRMIEKSIFYDKEFCLKALFKCNGTARIHSNHIFEDSKETNEGILTGNMSDDSFKAELLNYYSKDRSLIYFFPSILKNDISFVEKIIAIDGNGIFWDRKNLNNKALVEKAIEAGGNVAGIIGHTESMEILSDIHIAELAISQYGELFKCFSKTIRNQEKFIELAIANNVGSSILRYIPKKFRDNDKIVNSIVNQDDFAIFIFYEDILLISERLRSDIKFMLHLFDIMKKEIYRKEAMKFIPEALSQNEEFMKQFDLIEFL